jgi:hypothetical protein
MSVVKTIGGKNIPFKPGPESGGGKKKNIFEFQARGFFQISCHGQGEPGPVGRAD